MSLKSKERQKRRKKINKIRERQDKPPILSKSAEKRAKARVVQAMLEDSEMKIVKPNFFTKLFRKM